MRTTTTSVNDTTGAPVVTADESPCKVTVSNPSTGSALFFLGFKPGSASLAVGQHGMRMAAGAEVTLKLPRGVGLYAVGNSGGGSVNVLTTFLTQQGS